MTARGPALVRRVPSGGQPRRAARLGARPGRAGAFALLATAVFLLPAVVSDATVGNAGQLAAGHIPVQAGDYFSAVNGRTPLVDYIASYVEPAAAAPGAGPEVVPLPRSPPLSIALVRALRSSDCWPSSASSGR